MEKQYLIWIFLLGACSAQGQSTATLSGEVLTPEGLPLELANVTLHQARDSAFISYAISDKNGYFEFEGLPASSCFVVVDYIGHPSYSSEVITIKVNENFQLPDIRLSPPNNELSEVEVTATKPLFEVKADKIVFNVAGTINSAGSNALQLLRKSPGVVVTNDDDITLLGQQGVRVYLDGKPFPSSGKDLAAFLRTLQASEIENIEIITNPSSKYDAQGSAGIINIRLKKDKKHGVNTILDLSYSIGEKSWYGGTINSNYRNKKINLFGSYKRSIGESQSTRLLIREQQDFIFEQSNVSLSTWSSNNFKVGADLYLNERSTLGFQVNGFFTDFTWEDNGRTLIYNFGEMQFDSILVAQYNIEGLRKNLNYNLNFRTEDNQGNDIIMDLDYARYSNPTESYQPNFIYDPTGENILSQNIFANENPTDIDLLIFKTDYSGKFREGAGNFDLGLKTNFSNTDYDFKFYQLDGNTRAIDTSRSNQFIYSEKVIAAYTNFVQRFGPASFQWGLRCELTTSHGRLSSFKQTENDDISRKYFDYFPSLGFTYELNPANRLQANYSRRINRPSFEDLNPFTDQKDEFSFEQGNPFLNPEYTQKFQLGHALNSQLFTSIIYSRTKDLIVRIRDTIGISGTLRGLENLAEQKNLSINTSVSHQLTKWWSTYTSLTGYYIKNKANFGKNKAINLDATAYNIYSQHVFSLPKSFSIEISGWYNSPSIWGATFESEAIWNIDVGIQKKLWDKRGTISINVSDLFFSSGWYGVSKYAGVTVTSSGNSDSRRLSVYFSYLLGNKNVKKNKRETGLEEERERIEKKRSDKG